MALVFQSSLKGQGTLNPSVEIKVENLEALQSVMSGLAAEIQIKILRQIVLHGARIIKDQAIAEAPVGNYPSGGRLRNSIVVRRETSADEAGMHQELARVIVARSKHKVFYAHLVEFGHIWVIKKQGRTVARGHWSGDPFLTRAWDKKKEEAAMTMIALLRKKIILFANKQRIGLGLAKLPRGFAA